SIFGGSARVTVPKSSRGLLVRPKADALASMPVARCLSRLDDKPIALAWNGDAVPRGPVSVAGRDSCRRSAYLGQIAILLRPRPVSENRQPCQRLQELQLWS